MILQPCKSYFFPVSFRETGNFLVKKLTMHFTISIKNSCLLKKHGNFDHLETSLVAYFTVFAWNWPDLQKIITDFLQSLLIFCVNLPFCVKLTCFAWNWSFSQFYAKKAQKKGLFCAQFSETGTVFWNHGQFQWNWSETVHGFSPNWQNRKVFLQVLK